MGHSLRAYLPCIFSLCASSNWQMAMGDEHREMEEKRERERASECKGEKVRARASERASERERGRGREGGKERIREE